MRDNKNKRLIAFLILFLFSLSFSTFSSSAAVSEKIKGSLKEKLPAAKADQSFKVLVLLKERPVFNFKGFSLKELRERSPERIRTLKETTQRTQAPLLKFLEEKKNLKKVTSFKSFWIVNLIALEAPREIIEEISQSEAVEAIYEDEILLPPNDPISSASEATATKVTLSEGYSVTWGLEKIGAYKLWELGISGEGIVVGSIDSGVDANHPTLVGKMATTGNNSLGWYDAIDGNTSPLDTNGHGTHTIGTMVGGYSTSDQVWIGVAPGAKYYSCRVWGTNSTSNSTYLAAGQWMIDPDGNPDTADQPIAINNSWHNSRETQYSEWFREMIRSWRSVGIVPVYAIGNEGRSGSETTNQPGNYPESFGVGATDVNDNIAEFSSRGPAYYDEIEIIKPDVSAPGVDVLSADNNDDDLVSKDGTSMAAPHVAGTVALLLQKYPDLSVEALRASIESTSIDLGENGKDNTFGEGRIDAYAAVSGKLLPYFTLLETKIDDSLGNSNGKIDPGETINLIVTLKNVRIDAPNVTLNLKSSEEMVNITQAQVNLGDIPLDTTVSNQSDPFTFGVSPDLSSGQPLGFVLDITSNRDTQTLSVTLSTPSFIPFQAGNWPVSLEKTVAYYAMVNADLDGDGKVEIVLGSNYAPAKIFVIRHDGSIQPGFENLVLGTSLTYPSLGDLDLDGDLEIIVGVKPNLGEQGEVYILNHQGEIVKQWNTAAYFPYVILGDVNQDGDLEIIMIGNDKNNTIGYLSLYDSGGNPLPGLESPYAFPSGVKPVGDLPSVGDIDNNPANGSEIVVSTNNGFYIFRYREGTLESSVIAQGKSMTSATTLGDLDRDGDLEIVGEGSGYIYVYHHDGTQALSKYINSTDWKWNDELVLANIDQDEELEIIGEWLDNSGSTGLFAYNLDGSEVSGFPVNLERSIHDGKYIYTLVPVVGDIDGDGKPEIIAPFTSYAPYQRIEALNEDGTKVKGFPLWIQTDYRWLYPLSLADLDGDGDVELLASASDGSKTFLYAFDLAGKYDPQKMEWPMFHHDALRTGNAKLDNYRPLATNLSVSTLVNTAVQISLEAIDGDQDPLTYSIVEAPLHGTLSSISGNQVTYTPTAEYRGSDSFTYQAFDGKEYSNVAQVEIEVTGCIISSISWFGTDNYIGSDLKISGSNFGNPAKGERVDTAENNVKISGKIIPDERERAAVGIVYWDNHQIWLKIPPSIEGEYLVAGDHLITVTASGEISNKISIEVGPKVTKVPSEARIGDLITIEGYGFGKDKEKVWVSLGGMMVTPESVADTTLGVNIPQEAPRGTTEVWVEVNGKESNQAEIVVSLKVKSKIKIEISAIKPKSFPAGAIVTIWGENFGSTSGQVLFMTNSVNSSSILAQDAEEKLAGKIKSWSETKIEVEAPSALKKGAYKVKVVPSSLSAQSSEEDLEELEESDPVDLEVTAEQIPGQLLLYPNPFDPRADLLVIQFNAEGVSRVGIYIFDSTARLVHQQIVSGTNQTTWNGKDLLGSLVGDGLYLVRVINEDSRALIAKGKILVVKR